MASGFADRKFLSFVGDDLDVELSVGVVLLELGLGGFGFRLLLFIGVLGL